jgi:hypothetical protein
MAVTILWEPIGAKGASPAIEGNHRWSYRVFTGVLPRKRRGVPFKEKSTNKILHYLGPIPIGTDMYPNTLKSYIIWDARWRCYFAWLVLHDIVLTANNVAI